MSKVLGYIDCVMYMLRIKRDYRFARDIKMRLDTEIKSLKLIDKMRERRETKRTISDNVTDNYCITEPSVTIGMDEIKQTTSTINDGERLSEQYMKVKRNMSRQLSMKVRRIETTLIYTASHAKARISHIIVDAKLMNIIIDIMPRHVFDDLEVSKKNLVIDAGVFTIRATGNTQIEKANEIINSLGIKISNGITEQEVLVKANKAIFIEYKTRTGRAYDDTKQSGTCIMVNDDLAIWQDMVFVSGTIIFIDESMYIAIGCTSNEHTKGCHAVLYKAI